LIVKYKSYEKVINCSSCNTWSNCGFEDDGITRKMSYYEMYPKRKPQITDESEEGN
jgi:hypothetical protein